MLPTSEKLPWVVGIVGLLFVGIFLYALLPFAMISPLGRVAFLVSLLILVLAIVKITYTLKKQAEFAKKLEREILFQGDRVVFPVPVELGRLWVQRNVNTGRGPRYIVRFEGTGIVTTTVPIKELLLEQASPTLLKAKVAKISSPVGTLYASAMLPINLSVEREQLFIGEGEDYANASVTTSQNVLYYTVGLLGSGRARSARLEFEVGDIRKVIARVTKGETKQGAFTFPSPEPVLLIYTPENPPMPPIDDVLPNDFYVSTPIPLTLVLDIPLSRDKRVSTMLFLRVNVA